MFLNSDATTSGARLEALQATLQEREDCALVSPVLYDNQTKEPYFHGFRINLDTLEEHHPTAKEAVRDYSSDVPRHARALYGTVLRANTRHLVSLGGFDPRYVAYYEDTDLSVRAEGGV